MSDKIVYLTSLPLLVFLAAVNGHTPHAVALLCLTVAFLIRDQWVSFLRTMSASCDGVNLGANWSGKARTALNFPLACLIYVNEGAGAAHISMPVLYALEALAFLLNLVSFHVYTATYWPYVRKSLDRK